MGTRTLCFLLLALSPISADEKYSGPPPAKPDIPYLVFAAALKEPEIVDAREEKRKDETVYIIPGTASPARTPESEPVFIIDARQIAPEHIQLHQLEVKDGNRQVSLSSTPQPGPSEPLHLLVKRINEHLYRIEASEMLNIGEYALTSTGNNHVFCFSVF